jgi:hypothetical protein
LCDRRRKEERRIKMLASGDIGDESVQPEAIARQALEDDGFLSELLEAATARDDAVRSKSFKALLMLSEEHPERLYPKWDHFVDLLGRDNNYLKYQAIYIIANLTRIDTENQFEATFAAYYDLLDGRSVMTAAHAAGNSGKIARAKPQLQARITEELFGIDDTHHPPGRKDLIKGYAIEAFAEYFEEAANKDRILEYVKKQLRSESPRTAKAAKRFLKRWGN